MIKLIIFDFDGVIIDSTKANIQIANLILKKNGKPKLTKSQEIDANTLTTRDFFNKYSSDIGVEEVLKSVEPLLMKHYSRLKLNKNALPMLEFLNGRYKLAIATNRGKETFQILNRLKIKKYFDYVVTCADVRRPKPDPEAIINVLKHFKFKASAALYVGDTYFDSEAAQKADVASIIYKNKKAGGDYIINDLLDIKIIFNKLNK